MPGMLPVLNGECVRQAVRTGLALGAQINKWSRFDRKNYFYADLPQGYQISQLYHPIVGEGSLAIETEDGEKSVVGIERIHLEQDAGKSVHDLHPTQSFVDLNRSGCALMEIVSKPDIRSPAQAGAYVARCGSCCAMSACDGNMDEGSMRADVNVSVRRPGSRSARAPRRRMSIRCASSCRRSKSRRGGRSI
jgi:aspartyl-tRNA(Asn)/glutamyl-tRNA(Gln) amidotransferase subunit B